MGLATHGKTSKLLNNRKTSVTTKHTNQNIVKHKPGKDLM